MLFLSGFNQYDQLFCRQVSKINRHLDSEKIIWVFLKKFMYLKRRPL
ncbi:hypothetical protein DX877_07330 [Xylella fastidiosa subsp. fastidiosa]|nr:hypothetical protein [Xylella fastidiosa subsp. fastidiosa]QIS25450.1 hypothetical protein F7G16_04015 [Xylella fastidiosa]RUA36797.1 hypothetical protein DX877_07330 [Xylella fastidiosa subsp. fastidiosa]RUA37085.1 hypothetical protein DX878_06875 [Xylella fastidiosa subsp. fastidiosa]TWP31739.1 hypothetical protein FNS27_10535 [Xylella fastidiosa subsp. fastidiosa]